METSTKPMSKLNRAYSLYDFTIKCYFLDVFSHTKKIQMTKLEHQIENITHLSQIMSM